MFQKIKFVGITNIFRKKSANKICVIEIFKDWTSKVFKIHDGREI